MSKEFTSQSKLIDITPQFNEKKKIEENGATTKKGEKNQGGTKPPQSALVADKKLFRRTRRISAKLRKTPISKKRRPMAIR